MAMTVEEISLLIDIAFSVAAGLALLWLVRRLASWLRRKWAWAEDRAVAAEVPEGWRWLAVLAGAIVLLALVPATLGVLWQLVDAALTVSGTKGDEGTSSDAAIRNLTFYLAAIGTAIFAFWRGRIARKQAETSEQGLYTDRFTKAVEQLGAERNVRRSARTVTYKVTAGEKTDEVEVIEFEGETAQLPSDVPDEDIRKGPYTTHERTEPNIEVRLGGLYA
ncbi:MAG: hypothetical protein AAFW69_10680, partial [Pseudomonadota bacterium]